MAVFEFNVPITRDNNNWCNLLIETLKTSFGTLSQQIANNNDDTKKLSQQIVDIDVRNQLEDLKNTLDNSIVAIKNTANDALQLAQSNATSITSMKDELRNEFRVELAVVNSKYTNLEAENVTLKNICADLQAENVQLKEDRDDNDIYSRKSNLVLKGIPESKDEDDNQCEAVVKTFFKNELKLNDQMVRDMQLVACHRFGQKSYDDVRSTQRPIIVRFVRFNDRRTVWDKRTLLKGTKFYINENYPRKIGYNRRKLQPIYAYAKQKKQYEKQMSFKGDRLIINRKTYTVNNINTLPADIHPSKLCTTENDKVLVSGGLLSEFSYLSNYYKSDITYDSKKYASIEHAYQHVRALHFKDQAAAAKIFATKDPSEAKRLSYSVRGFSDAEWSKIREDLMLKLLRIKFAAGSELARRLQATGSKLLAESGKDKFFSCGMPLIHPEILDSTKWKSNVLGKLQMKIRNELN